MRDLTGSTAAAAATAAGEIQSAAATDAAGNVLQAGQQAGALFNPLAFGNPNQARQGELDSLNAQIESLQGNAFDGGGLFGGVINDKRSRMNDQGISTLIARRDELANSPLAPVGLGQQGLNQAGFLTDPNAQFDFLQNNPLFQMGLDNANEQTLNLAAARGRLSSGDTLQQLNQNALLTASPLIGQQKQSIGDLLNIGQGAIGNQANILQSTAANQSNLLTGAAAAEAGGIVGAANARGAGAGNIFSSALQLGGAALASPAGTFGGAVPLPPVAPSDPLLKMNIKPMGTDNGHNVYSWDWNSKANAIGLYGSDTGVMADEVKLKNPDAVVTFDDGYMRVNYTEIGVKH